MTMPLFVLAVLWFLVIAAAITSLGYHYWVKPAAYLDRVGGQALEPSIGLLGEAEETPVSAVLRRVGQAFPASPARASRLRRRLIAAGYRSDNALAIMYGIQIVSAVGAGLLGALLLGAATDFGSQGVLALSLLFACGGYFLPNEILLLLIQRRRRILRHALPDAVDLLVICVEAGLGLDQALLDMSDELRHTHPQLSEEFMLATLELRAGTRRSEALRHLAERTGEEEIKKLVAVLIQSDRFGTSIAQALRTHSDFMRIKRRQIAEEKANKVGVKLVFPIFFFILPAMFLVTVGPALLHLIFEFFPTLKEFR